MRFLVFMLVCLFATSVYAQQRRVPTPAGFPPWKTPTPTQQLDKKQVHKSPTVNEKKVDKSKAVKETCTCKCKCKKCRPANKCLKAKLHRHHKSCHRHPVGRTLKGVAKTTHFAINRVSTEVKKSKCGCGCK